MVMLIHGSGDPGWGSFGAQADLADRYRLVLPHRSGYPPNPLQDAIDFERQAAELGVLLEPGTHIVGHSYGGVVSLFMVARFPERVASLTVIEPPAFGLVRGEPAAEELINALEPLKRESEPREYLAGFMRALGAPGEVPDPLPAADEAIVRATMVERWPWDGVIPLETIRAAGVPVLVVSGAHSAAFDAVCDVLVRELDAERAVLPGAGHFAQFVGPAFNDRLAAFVDAASA